MLTKTTVENRWIGLLLLFYFFGTLGISVAGYKDFFLPLTPLNLLLTLIIFLIVNKDFSKHFILLCFLIFAIGFCVETAGVKTGILFGRYSYGHLFGFKIFETPLIIGVNWLFLALSTHGVVQYFTKKWLWLILIPSFLMTGLDYIVEPVAMKLGFWSWENNVIPLQNYVMWFATSAVIHTIIYFFCPVINSKISFVVLIAQIIFFGFLNIFVLR